MQASQDMEKGLNEALLELHKLAIKHEDPHASISSGFIGPQQTCTQTSSWVWSRLHQPLVTFILHQTYIRSFCPFILSVKAFVSNPTETFSANPLEIFFLTP